MSEASVVVRTPLEIYRRFQQCLIQGTFEQLPEVVDVEGYTENCVGLTGWTTGLSVALNNFRKNVASALTEMNSTEEDVMQGTDSLVIRSRMEATHSGTFLGIGPTRRRVNYDAVDMIRVKNERIVWRFLLCDWHGVQQQLRS